VNDYRRFGTALPLLVTLQLVCGAGPSRAQSSPVALRSSQPSPVSGAVVLTADVPPDPELLAVQFKLDGYVLDEPVTKHPYEVVWSAASASSGKHMVTAEARYRGGAVVESAPLRLTVVNPPTFNRTFYVDAEHGNDGKDGTSAATAWRTLDKANHAVTAGDTVLLRGTFSAQQIRPAVPGTPAKPITFRSYSGQTAVLNGGSAGVAVRLETCSYIVLDGLRIQNVVGYAIQIGPGGHHNVVRNAYLTKSGTASVWGHAIKIIESSDNLIERNQIVDIGDERANSGDSIYIVSDAHRNRILDNTLRNGGHSLIQMGSQQSKAPSTDNVIAGNTLSNFYTTPVILAYGSERTLIEYNTISDGARNGINYPRPGIQIAASENVVRHNEVFNNAAAGIALVAYVYDATTPQDSIGNRIYHNVFYGNGTYGLWISEKHGRTVRDNLIANNIFFRNRGFTLDGRTYTVGIEHYHNPTAWPVGGLNGNRIENNILLRQPGAAGEPMVLRIRSDVLGGNLAYTLARFQATHREATDNLEVDPQFTDEAKRVFTLRPGSPAARRGVRIPGVSLHGGAPDIGAFEPSSERRSAARP
jgi:parallel beta helix pectate lyase-like protein